jgi:hypothetical protein
MEYYLAVRMRRFGRAFQPSDSSSERTLDRTVGRGGPTVNGTPIVTGVGTPRLGSARPVTRPIGRTPGRY